MFVRIRSGGRRGFGDLLCAHLCLENLFDPLLDRPLQEICLFGKQSFPIHSLSLNLESGHRFISFVSKLSAEQLLGDTLAPSSLRPKNIALRVLSQYREGSLPNAHSALPVSVDFPRLGCQVLRMGLRQPGSAELRHSSDWTARSRGSSPARSQPDRRRRTVLKESKPVSYEPLSTRI